MLKRSRWLIAGLGIVISAVFLWAAFGDLKPAEVWASIQAANVPLLLAAMAWYFAAVSIITMRWQFLLRGVKPVGIRHLFPLVCIGYAGNNIYPFRSGEILRVLLLQRNHGVPVARATTVIIVERIFDGLVMLSFILIPLLFLDISSPEVRSVAVFAAPIFVGALIVFLILATRPNLLRSLLLLISRALPGRLGKLLEHLGEEVISGLEGLRTPADLIGAVVTSYITWGLEASVYWIVSAAFNLDVTYPVMLLTVGVVNLAGLIPASPGQFGVFEFFVSVVLAAVGTAPVQTRAYALVIHMVIWLPVTLVGLFFLARQGLGLDNLTRASDLKQPAAG